MWIILTITTVAAIAAIMQIHYREQTEQFDVWLDEVRDVFWVEMPSAHGVIINKKQFKEYFKQGLTPHQAFEQEVKR